MNKMPIKLQESLKKIPLNSTQLILAACVAAFFLIVVVFVVLGAEDEDEIVMGDVVTSEVQTSNVVTPPVLESPFDESALADASTAEPEQSDEIENIESMIPTLQSSESVESVKKEPKRIKPSDMIVYLKGIQGDITMQDNSFIHNNIYYYVGDLFEGWWVIERITPNFIRFQEKDYAYNLRFFEKGF